MGDSNLDVGSDTSHIWKFNRDGGEMQESRFKWQLDGVHKRDVLVVRVLH